MAYDGRQVRIDELGQRFPPIYRVVLLIPLASCLWLAIKSAADPIGIVDADDAFWMLVLLAFGIACAFVGLTAADEEWLPQHRAITLRTRRVGVDRYVRIGSDDLLGIEIRRDRQGEGPDAWRVVLRHRGSGSRVVSRDLQTEAFARRTADALADHFGLPRL